ncbi:hypothetical protein JOL62DRAFT_435370 [Phyllosticta paracitricarpa]|uniref:Uncharacterized protein n=2 Tax=Phyllosticta TaxID=121621 RepID=A0ABR1MIW4_9PEZI
MRRYRPTCAAAAAAAAWPLPTHQPWPWWQASWPCRRGQFRLLHWEQRWSLQAAKRLAGSVLQSVSRSVPSTYLPTYLCLADWLGLDHDGHRVASGRVRSCVYTDVPRTKVTPRQGKVRGGQRRAADGLGRAELVDCNRLPGWPALHLFAHGESDAKM